MGCRSHAEFQLTAGTGITRLFCFSQFFFLPHDFHLLVPPPLVDGPPPGNAVFGESGMPKSSVGFAARPSSTVVSIYRTLRRADRRQRHDGGR